MKDLLETNIQDVYIHSIQIGNNILDVIFIYPIENSIDELV
jgi:hypothetical protein